MPKIVVNEEKPNASHDMVFAFPDTWEAVQYDAPNGFYRKHYKQFADSKCVDIVAFDSDRTQTTVWLIEVKDYRAFPRKDTSDILSEIAEKVRGTLACLLAGAFRDRSSFEGRVIQAQKICVAFHLEQPTKKSKF